MIKNRLIAAFISGFLVAGCNEKPKNQIEATVLESEEVIVSEITPQQLIPLDTLNIVDGSFGYSIEHSEPIFLLFEFSSGARVPVLVEEKDELLLAINDTVPYGTFTAIGSPAADRMARQRDLFVETAYYFDSINYVNAMYSDSANFADKRQELNTALRSRLDVHRIGLQNIIDEDTTDLSNIMAFYQSLGRVEFFQLERDFTYYRKVGNGLKKAYPNNAHTTYFLQKLADYQEALNRQELIAEAARNVKVGAKAPEITLPDPEGNMRSLSDLRGKIVLIDFWASWCGPCRRANPDLVKLYDRYFMRGFEIFSVSLDGVPQQANAKNDWRFAIEKDNLHWPNHVSDLKGYNSSVVDQYGFEGIPFTILVDVNGRILARNLRGRDLENELAKLF